MSEISIGAAIVGVFALLGATGVGWVLFRLDKWASGRMDEIDDWLELHDAVQAEDRARHPAVRARVMTMGDIYCPQCRSTFAGPRAEHLCGAA